MTHDTEKAFAPDIREIKFEYVFSHEKPAMQVVLHDNATFPMRILRLEVDAECAHAFEIEEIVAGRISLLVSQAPVPADRFASKMPPMDCPILGVGCPFWVKFRFKGSTQPMGSNLPAFKGKWIVLDITPTPDPGVQGAPSRPRPKRSS